MTAAQKAAVTRICRGAGSASVAARTLDTHRLRLTHRVLYGADRQAIIGYASEHCGMSRSELNTAMA